MSEDNDDFPKYWPRTGNRLFVQNCWKLDAEIATFRGERIYRMKNAFKNAADLLVIYTAENAHERRNLVWPIVFCYRQYIELALKDVIAEYGLQMLTVPKIEPNWKTHKLKDLWVSYKQIIGSTLSETTADEIPEVLAVEACIDEFHEIDEGSYTFRYPADTEGRQIDIPFSSIDVYHLQDVMEGIYNFLDASESALDAHFKTREGRP